MMHLPRNAPIAPLNASYYVSYFNVVSDISEEQGLSYMTLSPENQAVLKQLLYDYKLLQDRKAIGEDRGEKAPGKQNVVPIRIKVDNI
jgi:hypothetical protein